jgi:hypothetical protein
LSRAGAREGKQSERALNDKKNTCRRRRRRRRFLLSLSLSSFLSKQKNSPVSNVLSLPSALATARVPPSGEKAARTPPPVVISEESRQRGKRRRKPPNASRGKKKKKKLFSFEQQCSVFRMREDSARLCSPPSGSPERKSQRRERERERERERTDVVFFFLREFRFCEGKKTRGGGGSAQAVAASSLFDSDGVEREGKKECRSSSRPHAATWWSISSAKMLPSPRGTS